MGWRKSHAVSYGGPLIFNRRSAMNLNIIEARRAGVRATVDTIRELERHHGVTRDMLERVGEAVAAKVEEAAYRSGVARRERATSDSEF